MANYWRLVNRVIEEADILLLVLDSRMPDLTRNREIEQKVKFVNKKLIYVLNKCDLIEKEFSESIKKEYSPSVFVSCTKKLGGTLLFKKIMELAKGGSCVVGVLGYPNVGKSSIINMLKGRHSASVSSESGHTRSIQMLKAKGKIKLLDTPGVLDDDNIIRLVLIGSKNPQSLDDPEYYAMELVKLHHAIIEKFYNVKYDNEPYDFLEKIASEKNIIMKKGLPDTKRLSVQLLHEWQTGKMHEVAMRK